MFNMEVISRKHRGALRLQRREVEGGRNNVDLRWTPHPVIVA